MARTNEDISEYTGASRVRKRSLAPGRAPPGNDHVAKRFGERLAALVPLDHPVSQLCDFIQGFTAGEPNDGRGDALRDGEAEEAEEGGTARPIRRGSGRYVWQLLSRFLAGDTPSGLIPMPTLPAVDFTGHVRGGEAIAGAIVEDEVLGACFRDAAFPLSAASLETVMAGMDWSLSTLGPCARSQAVLELCGRGGGVVGRALDMEKVGQGMATGAVRGRIFERLGLKMHAVDDAIDVMCAWDAGHEGQEGQGGRDCDSPGIEVGELATAVVEIREEIGKEIEDQVMMIRQAAARGQSRSQSRSTMRRAAGPATGLTTSSSEFGNEATWEHVCCALATPWVYAMEQAVATCSSLIDWSTLSESAIAGLAQVDFALVDEAAFRAFDERMRGVPEHVGSIVEECASLCRCIIHQVQEVQRVMLDRLGGLRPLLEATASQSDPRQDPRLDAARKSIIAHRALFPGKSQLVMISKRHQQALHAVLRDSNITVLELNLPQHASYFEAGVTLTGAESTPNADGVWNDYDCLFLSTDEDTLREAMDGAVFRFFKRIVLLETDPTLCRVIEPLLRSSYNRGAAVSLLRVGLGLGGTSTFRLEVPECAADGSGDLNPYESMNEILQHGESGVAFGMPAKHVDTACYDHRHERLDRLQSRLDVGGEHAYVQPQNMGNQWQRQTKTSLGDTSLVKPIEPPMAPGMGLARRPSLSPTQDRYENKYRQPNNVVQLPKVAQLADNLFSDREDSFLHDSFLERNSARGANPNEHLVQAGWTPFHTERVRNFDASLYLQASNHRGPAHGSGWGGSPEAPGPAHVPMHSPEPRVSEFLFHHENARPFDLEQTLPLDQMVGGAGSFPGQRHLAQTGSPAVYQHVNEEPYFGTKLGQMYGPGGRSPLSPLDVMHIDDLPLDGGGTPVLANGHRQPNLSPYPYPYSQTRTQARPQDIWDVAYSDVFQPPPYPHAQQPSPHPSSGRRMTMVSPVQLATPPPRFWPQPMNPTQAFNNIEKMYDEMRAGRPKRRPQRRGERYKRFS